MDTLYAFNQPFFRDRCYFLPVRLRWARWGTVTKRTLGLGVGVKPDRARISALRTASCASKR